MILVKFLAVNTIWTGTISRGNGRSSVVPNGLRIWCLLLIQMVAGTLLAGMDEQDWGTMPVGSRLLPFGSRACCGSSQPVPQPQFGEQIMLH